MGGFDEPLYQPATAPGQQHSLYYREDFFASALHAIAHWCIAGYDRRQLTDFGYWYEPDGAGDAIHLDKLFEQRVIAQARAWRGSGLPTRAGLFFSALCEEFGTVDDLTRLEFLPTELE